MDFKRVALPLAGLALVAGLATTAFSQDGPSVAERTFMGANCRLCSGTDWTIEYKGF